MAVRHALTSDEEVPSWPGMKAAMLAEEEVVQGAIDGCRRETLAEFLRSYQRACVVTRTHLTEDDALDAHDALDGMPAQVEALIDELRSEIPGVNPYD